MGNIIKYLVGILFLNGIVALLLSFFMEQHALLLSSIYIYTGVCAVLMVAALVHGIMSSPGTLKSMIIFIVGLAVVFGISFVVASDIVEPDWEQVSAFSSKMAGMGLIMSYMLMAGAVAAMLYSSVSKMIK